MSSDFGFSFEDDPISDEEMLAEHNNKVKSLEEDVERLYNQNREMFKKIVVFLTNLQKDPEKPVIKWPNRVEAINKFKDELETLYEKAKTPHPKRVI